MSREFTLPVVSESSSDSGHRFADSLNKDKNKLHLMTYF